MNKGELVERVAAAAGLDKRTAEAAVDGFIDAVIAETKSGNYVSLFGFGKFAPTSRAARMGRNPQTGAPVPIAASKGVKFSPATAYKSALNKSAGAGKGPAKKTAKSATKKR